MSDTEVTAAEAAPTQPADEPVAEAAEQQQPEGDASDDRWRAKYERADRHLQEKVEALKEQASKIAELEQKLSEATTAKAEAEATAEKKLEELQKQIQLRDFQRDVLKGVAQGKVEQAEIMLRGLGVDPSTEDAVSVAVEQLRKVAPELYASAPVKSAGAEDNTMRQSLVGTTWGTLSAEQRRYVKTRPEFIAQLNRGVITHTEETDKRR